MNLKGLQHIFYRIALCVLFAWFKGASAGDVNDYSSLIGTPYRDKNNGHVIDNPDVHMPPASETTHVESSFSDIAGNRHNPLSFIDIDTPTLALDIPARPSSNDWDVNEPGTTFHELQDLSPETAKIDGYNRQRKGHSYSGYVSSAPEAETWLMILVGITLIGLQVIRGNKKTEPIYSSLH